MEITVGRATKSQLIPSTSFGLTDQVWSVAEGGFDLGFRLGFGLALGRLGQMIGELLEG